MKTLIHPYKPTQIQNHIHGHKARFKVCVMGRRSGKSVLLLNEAIQVCLETPKAKCWLIATTYGQAKDIYWRDSRMIKEYILPEYYAKKNDGELLIEFRNGSIFQLKGADRPELLRGSGLDFLGCDEISEWRYSQQTWEEILLPSLSDKQGRCIFIFTPKGFNYAYQLYKRGLGAGKDDWKSWRIPTWDSQVPWLDTEKGKQEMVRAISRAQESKDAMNVFMQEFGAKFRKYVGLVFKDFDVGVHVRRFDIQPSWQIECGMDFGLQNPTTCIFAVFDEDDNCYIIDEYGARNKTIFEHAGKILAIRNEYKNPLRKVSGDSANAQEIKEFGAHGWFVSAVQKTKDSVSVGISKIQERLAINPINKKPRLLIAPHCKGVINEFQRYRWQESKDSELNKKEKPEKADDHYLDALRYMLLSHGAKKNEVGRKHQGPTRRYKPLGGYT